MVSAHIRSNIVGYIALFLALTGTATALPGKNSVKAKDIAKGAVTTPKIRGGAVTAAKLAQGSVGAGAIASQAVGADEIATGAVGASELANGAVGTSKLASGAVGTSALASGAVTTGKIADAAVTGAQLDKPTLGLGPESFGPIPALRVAGSLTQTAPAIDTTTVEWDSSEVWINIGGWEVGENEVTVPVDGLYYVHAVVPWGEDPAEADRQFVTDLLAGGDLVQGDSARAVQHVGFNYGPTNEAAGLVELEAGAVIAVQVYYSGDTPTGGIPLGGYGPPVLEAVWVGPN